MFTFFSEYTYYKYLFFSVIPLEFLVRSEFSSSIYVLFTMVFETLIC